MSDIRIPDQVILTKMPRKQGKIQHGLIPSTKIKIYGAYQFTDVFDRGSRNFYPIPPVRNCDKKEWCLKMFRVKKDGKWIMRDGVKYVFFTIDEVSKMLLGDNQWNQS